MAVKLKCKYCEKKFVWKAGTDEWPDECPLCHADISIPPTDEIVMPMMHFGKSKAADQVYRQMEAGAEHRINVASEMTGMPKSDFSELKITNMKDNMRAGESAAIEPKISPEMNQALQTSQNLSQFGLQFSAGTAEGKHANAGARMTNVLRQKHGEYAPHAVASMADRPALETTVPGYRRRV